MEKSKELAKEYSEKAKKSLEMFGEKAEFLVNLTDYLIDRKILKEIVNVIFTTAYFKFGAYNGSYRLVCGTGTKDDTRLG